MHIADIAILASLHQRRIERESVERATILAIRQHREYSLLPLLKRWAEHRFYAI